MFRQGRVVVRFEDNSVGEATFNKFLSLFEHRHNVDPRFDRSGENLTSEDILEDLSQGKVTL